MTHPNILYNPHQTRITEEEQLLQKLCKYAANNGFSYDLILYGHSMFAASLRQAYILLLSLGFNNIFLDKTT